MNKRDFTLAAMSCAGRGSFTPVQLQKFLFILDREIAARLGGSGFNFQPYHYGPYDSDVYATLETLEREGLAIVAKPQGDLRSYELTDAGRDAGRKIAARLDEKLTAYVGKVADFVRSQSFVGLVSTIYKKYPDMQVNSVFLPAK